MAAPHCVPKPPDPISGQDRLIMPPSDLHLTTVRGTAGGMSIDFDGKVGRLQDVRARIPEHLAERVFVLGALTEPEALKQANLGPYEEIGLALACACREETDTTWGHARFDTMKPSLPVYASGSAQSCSL